MVNYKCFRCGYETKFKSSFLNHLNRKNICIPMLEDISIENIKISYGFINSTKLTPNHSILTPNNSKSLQKQKSEFTPNNSIFTPNHSILTPNNSKIKNSTFECEFCNKFYSRKDNLTKHLKNCKKKREKDSLDILKDREIEEKNKEIDNLKDKVEDLIIELSKKNIITNNTTNNNTINNNTTNNQNKIINIHINNFGNENTKYLRKDYLNNLLEKAFTAIPKLIEKIHFNPKHPENHNIKITNKKEPYIKVRKNDKWELQDKKETLENLVDEKYYILEDHYAEVEENKEIPEKTKNVMDKFRDKYTEDKELQKELQKKSEMIILNNS